MRNWVICVFSAEASVFAEIVDEVEASTGGGAFAQDENEDKKVVKTAE